MKLFFKNADDLADGIAIVADDLGFTVSNEAEAFVTVTVKETDRATASFTLNGKCAEIVYGDGKARFFRALMELICALRTGDTEESCTLDPLFKTNGAMLDVSRNAVMNMKYLKV